MGRRFSNKKDTSNTNWMPQKTRKIEVPFCFPDRDDWFHKFWEACCLQVRIEHKYLFFKINCDRIVPEADEDFNEKQV